MEDSERAVGIFMDADAGLDEVPAVGLFGDLQEQPVIAHGVVVLDLTGFLD